MNYTSLSEIIKTKPNSIVSALSWPEWLSLTVAVQHPLLSKKKKEKKDSDSKRQWSFLCKPTKIQKNIYLKFITKYKLVNFKQSQVL